jgi:DNA polymerase III delta prime subunit
MSARLFVSPTDKQNGGVTAKHLQHLIFNICKKNKISVPKLDYGNHSALAQYLSDNFSNYDIDKAHNDVIDFYESVNKDRKVRVKNTQWPTQTQSHASVRIKSFAEIEQLKDRIDDSDNNKDSNQANNDQNTDDNKYVLKSDYAEDCKQLAAAIDEITLRFGVVNSKIANTDNYISKSVRDITSDIVDIHKKIEEISIKSATVIDIIKSPELPPIHLDIVHFQFPKLLKAANSRNRNGSRSNIWLYGPAGTGKTAAAEKLAEILFGAGYASKNEATRALYKSFYGHEQDYFNYNGSLMTKYELMGYMDANGKYVSTAFRKAWEFGGVYLFDEIDTSMPDALNALNGALANSVAPFPDKMVPRHKDCIILAGANTTGLGGGIEYIGAMMQNAAFLDRWDWLKWPHDDALETALCANKDWLLRVRKVRQNWINKGIKGHLITMRATLKGERLLAAGLSQAEVEEMVLKCGLSDAQWDMIK